MSKSSNVASPFHPLVDGVVAAVALGELAAMSPGIDSGSVAVFAVFVGIAAAVLARAHYLAPIADIFYSAIGVIACIPAAAEFLRGAACDTTPTGLRYAIFALLAVLAGLGVFAAAVSTGVAPKFGLRWFGAIELLTAASAPWGTEKSPHYVLLSAMILLAMPLGWLAARRSEAVLDGATSALAAAAILLAAFAPRCAEAADTDGIVLVVVFGVTFAAATAIGARIRTRH